VNSGHPALAYRDTESHAAVTAYEAVATASAFFGE
jgi:hypothetical protein